MALLNVRVLLPVSLICLTVAAQNAAHECEVPAAIQDLNYEQVKAGLPEHANDFHWLRRLAELAPQRPKPAPLASFFEEKRKDHPEDPSFVYLYAQSLVGKDTPQAISLLTRAAQADPAIPWIYQALAEIRASANFRDDDQVLANVRLYRKLCPGNLDGFRYLNKFFEPAETAALARDLRPLLENSKKPEDNYYWRLLWAAEFRVAPQSEHDVLRQRVAADVKRLEPQAASGNREVLMAIADGYKLTDRAQEAEQLIDRAYPDNAYHKAYLAWEKEHQVKRNGATRADYEVMFKEQAKAAIDWVARFPDSQNAWMVRLSSMTMEPNFSKDFMEKAGDAALKAAAAHPFGWSTAPTRLRVAQAWVKQGIRPMDCLAMAQQSLDEILQGPEVQSDLYGHPVDPSKESPGRRTYPYDSQLWEAMTVVLEAQIQLKQFGPAREMLARMNSWLGDNVGKKDDPTSGYSRFKGAYVYGQGETAEAEGHKFDAAALYARAVAEGWSGGFTTGGRPHQFWLEQGGTEEGWKLATQKFPAPKPLAQAKTPSAYIGNGDFRTYNQVLPEMDSRDITGKTWTLADLKGKQTFVTFWATWCEPCRDELPYVQKLYELVKGRSDVQVVTFNLDENPGEIEPFLRANRYSFPVVFGREYTDRFSRVFLVPESWIVDRNAVVRRQSLGFDTRRRTTDELNDWPKQIAERLTQVLE